MSDAVMGEMIASLRKLAGGGLVRAAAAEAAPLVQEAARATASAGTTPAGEAWAPRKKDGGRALANAASHIRASALGTLITITLIGADVWHHFSKGHRRQVIPDGGGTGIPAHIAAAIKRGADTAFEKATGAA